MRAYIRSLAELDGPDLRAWSELASQALSPNPFLEPEFVLPAARRAWRLDDVGVLTVRDGSDWLAALPVRSVRAWRGVPGRCLAAWRHTYCYLGTPLVRGEDSEAILATLLRAGLGQADSLVLDWIDSTGPLAESLTAALAAQSRIVLVEEFERAALYRRNGNDDTGLAQLVSSRSRRSYGRKLRLLEREVGEVTIRDRSADASAYQRFLELERSGWRGEWGTAMACRPGHAEFFADFCARFADKGRLRLLSLESEQQTLAMKTDLVAGDSIFFFKPVFNEQFGRFSPGMQLELANIEGFYAGNWTMFDACTAPENQMYNKLWGGRRRLRSVVAVRRGAAGTVSYAKWRAAVAVRPLKHKVLAAARRQQRRSGAV